MWPGSAGPVQAEARPVSQSAGLDPGGPQGSRWLVGSRGGPCGAAAGSCWPVRFRSCSVTCLVFSCFPFGFLCFQTALDVTAQCV